MKKKNYYGLEIISLICAFLVVANHISPFLNISDFLDFFVTRILARIAVPFFLMKTAFFSLDKMTEDNKYLKAFIFKILKYYLIAIVIYIPVLIYNNYFANLNLFTFLKDLLVSGMMYHLWYFPATILGVLLVVFLRRKLKDNLVLIVSIILYLIALLGDSYYGLIKDINLLNNIYGVIFEIFDYTRNGLMMVPIFLMLGKYINKNNLDKKANLIVFFCIFVTMTIEAVFLKELNFIRHDSMYLFLPIVLYFLFSYFASFTNKTKKNYQEYSLIIYIIHIFIMLGLRLLAKIEIFSFIADNLILFILTSVISLVVAIIFVKVMEVYHERKSSFRN